MNMPTNSPTGHMARSFFRCGARIPVANAPSRYCQRQHGHSGLHDDEPNLCHSLFCKNAASMNFFCTLPEGHTGKHATSADRCEVPNCTREYGHSGPCAMVVTDEFAPPKQCEVSTCTLPGGHAGHHVYDRGQAASAWTCPEATQGPNIYTCHNLECPVHGERNREIMGHPKMHKCPWTSPPKLIPIKDIIEIAERIKLSSRKVAADDIVGIHPTTGKLVTMADVFNGTPFITSGKGFWPYLDSTPEDTLRKAHDLIQAKIREQQQRAKVDEPVATGRPATPEEEAMLQDRDVHVNKATVSEGEEGFRPITLNDRRQFIIGELLDMVRCMLNEAESPEAWHEIRAHLEMAQTQAEWAIESCEQEEEEIELT